MSGGRDLGADSVLTVPGHVLSRRAGDEAVLLNLETEEYYGLAGVGNRLWELLADGTTLGQAVDTLLAEYDVDRAVLEDDVRSVVADLATKGLVLVDAT